MLHTQSKVHDAVTATTNAVAATRLAAKDAVSAITLAGASPQHQIRGDLIVYRPFLSAH